MSHHPCRYRADTGFEYRCSECRHWWPLDLANWLPNHGMSRCRTCWNVYRTMKQRGYDRDEARAQARRESNRIRYWANREKFGEAQRAWRARNKDRIAAYNREYRARKKAEILAYSRAYYADSREVILTKKRRAYAARKAA